MCCVEVLIVVGSETLHGTGDARVDTNDNHVKQNCLGGGSSRVEPWVTSPSPYVNRKVQ